MVSVFEGWDYEEIIPPLFDYADVFATPGLAARTYSFVGRDGSSLALRPDFTSLAGQDRGRPPRHRRAADPPLLLRARCCATSRPRPDARASCSRWASSISAGTAGAADAEILAHRGECLERLGIGGWVLALGHVGVFHGLVRALGSARRRWTCSSSGWRRKDRRGRARGAGRRKGVGRAADRARAPERAWSGIARRSRRRRGRSQCCPDAARAVAELREVADALAAAGLGDRVAIDLGEVRGLDYYTGLVFRAVRARSRVRGGRRRALRHAAARAWPADAGGRLHARPRPRRAPARAAAGAARGRVARPRKPSRMRASAAALTHARARRAAERASASGEQRDEPHRRPLKGKLLAGSESLFRRAGLPFPEDRGPAPRSRPGRPALPVREGHGRADLRRIRRGRLRHRRPRRARSRRAADVYEPLDLGFGRCRLVVARPRGRDRGRRARPPCASPPSTRGRGRVLPGAGRLGRGGAAGRLRRARAPASVSPTASWTSWRPAARWRRTAWSRSKTVAASSARLIVNRAELPRPPRRGRAAGGHAGKGAVVKNARAAAPRPGARYLGRLPRADASAAGGAARGGPHRPRGRARGRRGGGAPDWRAWTASACAPAQIRMSGPRCVAWPPPPTVPCARPVRAEHAHRGLPPAPAHGRVPLAPGGPARVVESRDAARVRGPLRARRRGRVPSSVLMNAIPALAASVPDLCDRDPAARARIQPGGGGRDRGGRVRRTRVYPGGRRPGRGRSRLRHADGPAVAKIAGPGNAYVAEAKRQVRGRVDIDREAGPSEVVILADETADAGWVAADLLAQAEHGSGEETVVLITTSDALAAETARLVTQGVSSVANRAARPPGAGPSRRHRDRGQRGRGHRSAQRPRSRTRRDHDAGRGGGRRARRRRRRLRRSLGASGGGRLRHRPQSRPAHRGPRATPRRSRCATSRGVTAACGSAAPASPASPKTWCAWRWPKASRGHAQSVLTRFEG